MDIAAISVTRTDSKIRFFLTVLVRFVLFKERIGWSNSAVEDEKAVVGKVIHTVDIA